MKETEVTTKTHIKHKPGLKGRPFDITSKTIKKFKGPMFPYGCPYCRRENVTSRPGNSCGRLECNEKWRKNHSGLMDKFKRIFH